MKRSFATAAVATLVLALAALGSVRAEEQPNLPTLRRKLLEARDDLEVGRALDKLQERIGKDEQIPDHAAFAEWLATLPDGRDRHPVVLQRRGWAYVHAKRGEEAVPPLRASLEDNPGSGLTRAYLGEALRQSEEHVEAARMLASAVRCGYFAKHVEESMVEVVHALRDIDPPSEAKGLPSYVSSLRLFLKERPDPLLHAFGGQLLLKDLAKFDSPSTERGRLWAEAAGDLVLFALTEAKTPIAGGAKLALDAAVALEPLDDDREGRTARFDLLALAYTLGIPVGAEGHDLPQAITLLAEAAEAEQRYALAWRLAQERLALADSPRVHRLLAKLPPDLGEREE